MRLHTWTLLTVGVITSIGLAGQSRQRVPADAASLRVGEAATICGRVARFECDPRGGTSFLTLDTRAGGPSFNIVIPRPDRPAFGTRLEDRYFQRSICVTGTVEAAQGGFQTIARRPDQLRLEDSTASPLLRPDAFRPCDDGVRMPAAVQQARARYTAEAMQAKIQGTVLVQGVVDTDGAVRDVTILRSLDPNGLDRSAVEALQQWAFEPGTRHGQPVAVVITAEMTFTLKP